MLQFIRLLSTSPLQQPLFQYISCCSLSGSGSMDTITCVQFQYISCCSLSEKDRRNISVYTRFNTSHIVVYQKWERLIGEVGKVSIHLMLQFIEELDLSYTRLVGCFNTSHVVVYLVAIFCIAVILRFNTSHVVVYLNDKIKELKTAKFQYISCCSLSSRIFSNEVLNVVFQYISCCSLSQIHTTSSGRAAPFQYISCCSLSLLRCVVVKLFCNTST